MRYPQSSKEELPKKKRKDSTTARKKRLLKCFEHLKKQKRVKKYTDISETMGIPSATVRGAFSLASEYFSETFLEGFLTAYPDTFNRDWIEYGKGQMLLETAPFFKSELLHRHQRVAHICEREGLSYTQMSRRLGMNSNTTMYRIVRRENRPQDSTLEEILRAFPHYQREWLFYGRGEMLKTPTLNETQECPPSPISSPQKGSNNAFLYHEYEEMTVPLIPYKARAGTLSGYGDEQEVSYERIIVEKAGRGEYALFTVRGVSMDDGSLLSLAEGDVVLARSIPRDYWRYKLHTHEWLYFIFVTRSEGIIIKSVTAQDTENGTFTCHSLNPEYEDIILHIEDISAIYNVIEVSRRSLKR